MIQIMSIGRGQIVLEDTTINKRIVKLVALDYNKEIYLVKTFDNDYFEIRHEKEWIISKM